MALEINNIGEYKYLKMIIDLSNGVWGLLLISEFVRYYHEGLDGGVWYSLFIKNLAHYSSH